MKENITIAGFSVHYREDGIIHYHFKDFSRASIDASIEISMRDDQEAMTNNQHLQRLGTFEGLMVPTPYVLSRMSEMIKTIPQELHISHAFVTTNTLIHRLISVYVKRLPPSENLEAVRFFKDKDNAILWLQEQVEP